MNIVLFGPKELDKNILKKHEADALALQSLLEPLPTTIDEWSVFHSDVEGAHPHVVYWTPQEAKDFTNIDIPNLFREVVEEWEYNMIQGITASTHHMPNIKLRIVLVPDDFVGHFQWLRKLGTLRELEISSGKPGGGLQGL